MYDVFIWYCSNCTYGPLNVALDLGCPMCCHQRCGICAINSLRGDRFGHYEATLARNVPSPEEPDASSAQGSLSPMTPSLSSDDGDYHTKEPPISTPSHDEDVFADIFGSRTPTPSPRISEPTPKTSELSPGTLGPSPRVTEPSSPTHESSEPSLETLILSPRTTEPSPNHSRSQVTAVPSPGAPELSPTAAETPLKPVEPLSENIQTPQTPLPRRRRGYRSARVADFFCGSRKKPAAQEDSPPTYCKTYLARVADRNSFASIWEYKVVPFLLGFLSKWLDSSPAKELDQSYAIDVFTGVTPETMKFRYIHITTAQKMPHTCRDLLQEGILELLPEPYRQETQFRFGSGRLERVTMSHAHGVSEEKLDIVCAPVRPHYEESPSPGSSIGVKGRTTIGTFGGRLLLRNKYGEHEELFMTCCHVLLDDDSEDGGSGEESNGEDESVVMQPSPQEAVILRERIARNREMIAEGSMYGDQRLWLETENEKWSKILDGYPADTGKMRLGTIFAASSGTRKYRLIPGEIRQEDSPPNAQVEMDWALGKTDDLRRGENKLPGAMRRFLTFSCGHQVGPLTNLNDAPAICREVEDPRPGAEAYSVGRTSGLQRGHISDVPSIIHWPGRDGPTREWVVKQHRQDTDEAQWVSHGIGVPGDSGSWLFGMDDVLYGLIWGRNTDHGEGERAAIFTPMSLVFEDIKEHLECHTPVLPARVDPDSSSDEEEDKYSYIEPLPAPGPLFQDAYQHTGHPHSAIHRSYDPELSISLRSDDLQSVLDPPQAETSANFDAAFDSNRTSPSERRNSGPTASEEPVYKSPVRSSTRSRRNKGFIAKGFLSKGVDIFRFERLRISQD